MTAMTPRSPTIFVTGMFAITAYAPFGSLFCVLPVLWSGIVTGHSSAAGLLLGGLLFVFFSAARPAFAILDGRPRVASTATVKRLPETASVIVALLELLGLLLWLRLSTPPMLQFAWDAGVQTLFPRP